MADKPVTRHRGSGRAAFIARLSTIRSEIANGDFLVTVHDRHKADLGITYSAFRKLVQRYADDAKPLRRTLVSQTLNPTLAPASPPPPVPPKPQINPQPASEGPPAHARHERTTNPSPFKHDGYERPDDRKRLLGED